MLPQPNLDPLHLVPGTKYLVLAGSFARLLSLAFCVAVFLGNSPFTFAEPLSGEQAVSAGKDALSRVTRAPWYDRREEKIRRLHVAPRDAADSENRGSTWTNNQPTTATTGGRTRTSFFGPILQWIGLSTLILLLGVLAFLIAKAFLKEELTESAVQRKVVEAARDVDRVEALPINIRSPSGDFLAEARRLYEAGQFSEAIIYLFSHQLLQLDSNHFIRLAKGKTNRQYLREVRQRPHIQSTLETTMIAFEDAFFGRKALTRDRFEQCWQRWDELQAQLIQLDHVPA